MCTFVLTAARFPIAGKWGQPRWPSTGSWIRSWYIHTMEFSHLWRKLNYEFYSEMGVRTPNLDKYHMFSLICGSCVRVCDRGERDNKRGRGERVDFIKLERMPREGEWGALKRDQNDRTRVT